jgi:hypothetical protein
MMKKHFVRFLSPGTFFTETTDHEIDSWDVKTATQMALDLHERRGSKPFGFVFITRAREDHELDSRETDSSHVYFLGGTIEVLDEIKARNDRNDRILISNMEANDWPSVVVNTNSWKVTQPFQPGDVLLDFRFPDYSGN